MGAKKNPRREMSRSILSRVIKRLLFEDLRGPHTPLNKKGACEVVKVLAHGTAARVAR